MKKVLFVGDINVDILMAGLPSPPVVDREIACESFEVALGSTAVICACAYAALGGHAAFAGLAGTDDYGEFMVRGLADLGVCTERVKRTAAVRTGVTVNLIHANTRTQVTYPGTIAEFDGAGLDEEALRGFDHVHLAGPYQQTRFRPKITRLLQTAKSCGIFTSLDPQWDATEQWEFMREWLPLLTYFFCNEDEARSITRAPSAVTACRALAAHTHVPVVKTGAGGCLLAVGGQVVAAPPFDVKVVDTTGAGDCFDAGFLYAVLEKRMPYPEAVAFANAVAARSCTFRGGTAARSTCEDIAAFMARTPATGRT